MVSTICQRSLFMPILFCKSLYKMDQDFLVWPSNVLYVWFNWKRPKKTAQTYISRYSMIIFKSKTCRSCRVIQYFIASSKCLHSLLNRQHCWQIKGSTYGWIVRYHREYIKIVVNKKILKTTKTQERLIFGSRRPPPPKKKMQLCLC